MSSPFLHFPLKWLFTIDLTILKNTTTCYKMRTRNNENEKKQLYMYTLLHNAILFYR